MRWAVLAAALTTASPLWADGEKAGDFDYYVMALSWSANWCALAGDDRDDPQCDAGRGLTWVLHGLWPQYEEGWPSYCRTIERDPSRTETAAMSDVFGGAGAAFYLWKKHGRCAGLSSTGFYDTARAAYSSVTMPPVFKQVTKDLKVPAEVIEAAFLDANPGMARDEITVTCDQGMIQEVRICLTKDLEPRRCAADSIRDCRMKDAVLEAVR